VHRALTFDKIGFFFQNDQRKIESIKTFVSQKIICLLVGRWLLILIKAMVYIGVCNASSPFFCLLFLMIVKYVYTCNIIALSSLSFFFLSILFVYRQRRQKTCTSIIQVYLLFILICIYLSIYLYILHTWFILCSKAFNQLIYKHPEYHHAMYNKRKKKEEEYKLGKKEQQLIQWAIKSLLPTLIVYNDKFFCVCRFVGIYAGNKFHINLRFSYQWNRSSQFLKKKFFFFHSILLKRNIQKNMLLIAYFLNKKKRYW
jgi:hypothetical protein